MRPLSLTWWFFGRTAGQRCVLMELPATMGMFCGAPFSAAALPRVAGGTCSEAPVTDKLSFKFKLTNELKF